MPKTWGESKQIDKTAASRTTPPSHRLVCFTCRSFVLILVYRLSRTAHRTAVQTAPTTAEETGTVPVHYRLDLDRVARLRAHQILRTHDAEGNGNNGINTHDGPLSLSEFTERWATSMPGVDTPSQELLKV